MGGVITDQLAALSCGIYQGLPVADLDYDEDSVADTDGNFVMTGSGKLVEIRAAEGAAFEEAEFQRLMALAKTAFQNWWLCKNKRSVCKWRGFFTEPKLIVASHNKGKLVEIADLLTRFEVETVGADALGLPEPEETGTTFIANAELKALAAAMTAGLPALSDDSGLAVDALDGAPGIYSARWARPPMAAILTLPCIKSKWRSPKRRKPKAAMSRAARALSVPCRWPGPMAMLKVLKARWKAIWYGRCAAKTASATTRYFCPKAGI